jgi:hypothetical protein
VTAISVSTVQDTGCDVRKITIFDRRTDTDHQVLMAKVNDRGDLILEGQDIGAAAEKFAGDSDYEYSRTVQATDVPAVLLHLISERFQSDGDFKQWLLAKGIDSIFDSWR